MTYLSDPAEPCWMLCIPAIDVYISHFEEFSVSQKKEKKKTMYPWNKAGNLHAPRGER